MSKRKVEAWVWVLIYAGMLLLGLGLAVHRTDAPTGWAMASCGVAVTIAGAVLVWVRSRMR